MDYAKLEVFESTKYDDEYPYYVSIRLQFRTKKQRAEFLRKIKKILKEAEF